MARSKNHVVQPQKTERDTPYMTFLPALEEGYDPGLRKVSGIVAGGGAQPERWLEDMARHMATDGHDVGFAIPDVLAAEQQMRRFLRAPLQGENLAKVTAWRGLMALCLLWDGWEKDDTWPTLSVEEYTADGSPFVAAVLGALDAPRRKESLRLLVLTRNHDGAVTRCPLAMTSRKTVLVPAADARALSALLPDKVAWYDKASQSFVDPCPHLNESDRGRLIAQLRMLQKMNESAALHSLLYDPEAPLVHVLDTFIEDLTGIRDRSRAAIEQQDTESVAALLIRVKAVCGLMPEKGYQHLTRQEEAYTSGTLRLNPLIACFAADDAAHLDDKDYPHQVTYLWCGFPFARESATIGLEPTHHPEEGQAMEALAWEIHLLEAQSPRWNRDLAKRLKSWLEQHRDSQQLSVEVLRLVNEARKEAETRGQKAEQTVQLTWPWQEDSAAVHLLLEESLGKTFTDCALSPFADRLTLLRSCMEDALGDVVLSRVCLMPGTPDLPQTMAIPPLSPSLARAVAMCAVSEEGKQLTILPDSFCFELSEEGITASFTIKGKMNLCLTRLYHEDACIVWLPDKVPTVTVWPSLPIRKDLWKAYFVYAHQPADAEVWALCGNDWQKCAWQEASDGAVKRTWQVQRTEAFPACLLLRQGSLCLGALLNILPPFMIQHAESAAIAVDFGTTGTTVMIRQGEKVMPMQASCLQRTLLHGPFAAPLSDEFMPNAPVMPILFSAEELFSDDPEAWQQPLIDGHACIPVSFDAICRKETGRLYYDLKWGTESFRQKVNRMYLYQVMMTASLTALLGGAPDVTWRIAVPGTMALAGRMTYWQLMNDLAREVAADTGMPLTPGLPPVSHTGESLASGMYFRSRNEVNIRGGFVTMDVGGGSAELSVWLRGMERPASSCSLPMGAQFMLLDSLLTNPEGLKADFAQIEEKNILRELTLLTDQFAVARGSRRSLQKCRFMLDAFLGEHLPSLSRYMNVRYGMGECTLTQALLLLNFSFLLMLSGQMLEQAYQDKTLNDLLPGYMEICVSGRGCLLMLGLAETLRPRLMHFIRLPMSRNHPVREFRLVVSSAPKMEVATGMLRMDNLSAEPPEAPVETTSGAPLPMTPMTLMKNYLTLFRAEFPMAAARVFPDLYADGGDSLLTRKAELTLQTIIDNQFNPETPLQVSFAACLEALKQNGGSMGQSAL